MCLTRTLIALKCQDATPSRRADGDTPGTHLTLGKLTGGRRNSNLSDRRCQEFCLVRASKDHEAHARSLRSTGDFKSSGVLFVCWWHDCKWPLRRLRVKW